MLYMRKCYHCFGLVGFVVVTGLMMGVVVSGCATTAELAPPVEGVVLSGGDRLGYGWEEVKRGREIYLSKCIKCHAVRRVRKYSAERWDGLLAKMSVKAKLDEGEESAVGAYVYSVLASLEVTEGGVISGEGGL